MAASKVSSVAHRTIRFSLEMPPATCRSAFLLMFVAISAGAQQLQVTPGDCKTGTLLVAKQVALSEVLRKLAQSLDFELKFEGDPARRIDANMTRPPIELVNALSAQDSMIVTQGRDPKCPGQNRIVKVWVLPPTNPATIRDAAAVRRPVPPTVGQAAPGLTPKEEKERRDKMAYDEYVGTHGVPPPTDEQSP